MKKKAILAIILVFCMCLSACGQKKEANLSEGDLTYLAIAEGQDVAKLDNGYADAIVLGYEATDGYLSAPITDEESIKMITDNFKMITVGEKVAEEDVVYYPSRTINFCYGEDTIVYYFAADTCYTYDSKNDVLNFYKLGNADEFLGVFDLLIIATNKDAFDDSYLVYDDSDCTASIINYEFDNDNGTFNIEFSLDNKSDETRVFKITDFAINGTPVETSALFAIDKGASFKYKAPVDLFGYRQDQISDITFKVHVTNAFENPTYEYDTETVSLAIAV